MVTGAGVTVDEEIDPNAPLPTFEIQPAMLAVDLSLMPGESRSCGFYLHVLRHPTDSGAI
jgi:hypothetical protein